MGALMFTYKALMANENALPELGGTVNTAGGRLREHNRAHHRRRQPPSPTPASSSTSAGVNAYVAPSLGEKGRPHPHPPQ